MRLRHSMCVMFGAFAISACASIHLGAGNETDVHVVDLKIGAGPIGWLDNETIVIIAQSGEQYARKDGAMQPITRMMTINYRTGEKKMFGKVSGEFCFSEGYVSYSFMDYATDELTVSYGHLGKETTRKIKPGEMNFDRGLNGSCRPWNEIPKPPEWAQRKYRVWNLRPEHGVINCNTLDIYGAERSSKARFHLPGDSLGIELPFSCYSVRLRLKYYPFRGAYFSPEHAPIIPWPVGRDRKAYWLFPDGKVETITLPYSSAVREDMVPTVRGIVAFGRPATREEDYGVYLVTPEWTKRILRGHAAGVTSPDGCKVAVLHDPDFDARAEGRRISTPVTLKVLEVCDSK